MPTRIYVDTSAIAKVFLAEAESPDLRQWLASQHEPGLVSSALLGVELTRLLGLVAPALVPDAERFLANDIDLVEITPPVLDDAARVTPARVRTLDAIHLATALDLGAALDAMLTYDKVLIDAAKTTGITVVHPGFA